MKRRASKNVFPIKPEKVSKPFMTGGGDLPKIVSLADALERAKPRSKAKGGKKTAASKTESKKRAADRERQDLENRYIGATFDDDDVPNEGAREVVRIEKDEDGTGEWTAITVLVDNEDNEVPYFVNAVLDEMIAEYQSVLVPAVSGGSGSSGGSGRGDAKKPSAKRAKQAAAAQPYSPSFP